MMHCLLRADWYPAGVSTGLEIDDNLVGRFLDDLVTAGAAQSEDEAFGLIETYVEEEIESAGAWDGRVSRMGLRSGQLGKPTWFAERDHVTARRA